MAVQIRTIWGEAVSLPLPPSSTVLDAKRAFMVHRGFSGPKEKWKFLLRGQELRDADPLADMHIGPTEFLVAIQTGRKGQGKKKRPEDAADKENPGQLPGVPAHAGPFVAPEPHRSPPRLINPPAGHNLTSNNTPPCDRQGAASPGVSCPRIPHTAAVSPATSSDAWTLLPGYISRPNPSPIKPKIRPPPDAGGFLRPGEDGAHPVAPGTSTAELRVGASHVVAAHAADLSRSDANPRQSGTTHEPGGKGREDAHGTGAKRGEEATRTNGGGGRREGLADSVWQSLAQELAGAAVTRPDVDGPDIEQDGPMPTGAGLQGSLTELKDEPLEGHVGVAMAGNPAVTAGRAKKKSSSRRITWPEDSPQKNPGDISGDEEDQPNKDATGEALTGPKKRRKSERTRTAEAPVGDQMEHEGSEREQGKATSGEVRGIDGGEGGVRGGRRGKGTAGAVVGGDREEEGREKGGRGTADGEPGVAGTGIRGGEGGRRAGRSGEGEGGEGEAEGGGRRRQRRAFATYRDPRGLLLRMVQHKLLPQEAASLNELPLPPVLERLERIFGAFNAVYGFLLRQHIQATWSRMKQAVRDILGDADVHMRDIEVMVQLCPEVVILRNRQLISSPGSMVQRRQLQARSAPLREQGPEETLLVSSGSEDDVIPVNTANPQEIRTDGAGTLLEGEKDVYIIEIVDPGKRTGPAASLEAFGADPSIGEVGMDSRSLGARIEPQASQEPTVRAGNNAAARRNRAFRSCLALATMRVHERHMQSGQEAASSAGVARRSTRSTRRVSGNGSAELAEGLEPSHATPRFCPVAEGGWYPSFRLQELSLAELVAAAAELRQGQLRNGSPRAGRGGQQRAAPRPPFLARHHEPCTDTSMMDTLEFLDHLKGLPWYRNQVVHTEDLTARQAKHMQPTAPLSEPLARALAAKGIFSLFSHQAKAIDVVMEGHNVVVATSTASGKSLCYNIPILEALAASPGSTAIYMFPTKALAQDQLRALRELCGRVFGDAAPHVDVYDGDTAKADRGEIRERAQLLITNPDMLHMSILPVHRQFSRLLCHLKYVVVDEGHAYRGVFGCHTALVLRRLRRLCSRVYNTSPSFIMTSATIANPREHMQDLLGVEDVRLVMEDGSPHGPQRFVLWNPPLTRQAEASAKTGNMHLSRTEGRARFGRSRSRRAELERLRSIIQEAEQERGRGVRLSQGPADSYGMSHADWLASVRMGRRRAKAAAAAIADILDVDMTSAQALAAKAPDTSLARLNRLLSSSQSKPSRDSSSSPERHFTPFAAPHSPARMQPQNHSQQLEHQSDVEPGIGAGQRGGAVLPGQGTSSLLTGQGTSEASNPVVPPGPDQAVRQTSGTTPVGPSQGPVVTPGPDLAKRQTSGTALVGPSQGPAAALTGQGTSETSSRRGRTNEVSGAEEGTAKVGSSSLRRGSATKGSGAEGGGGAFPPSAPKLHSTGIRRRGAKRAREDDVVQAGAEKDHAAWLRDLRVLAGEDEGGRTVLAGEAAGRTAELNGLYPNLAATARSSHVAASTSSGPRPRSGQGPGREGSPSVVRANPRTQGGSQRPLLRRKVFGLNLARPHGSQVEGSEEAEEDDAQSRLPEPAASGWKERHGSAGVKLDQHRSSPIVEISLLLAECIQHNLRTIAFCKTRKCCELVMAYTRETLKATAPHLVDSMSVYRAGYSPEERREIERALFSGELRAVAATNALELGVDVGSLDVTLHLGFPGSVASLWQQAGRAGRREQPSLSIYIAFDGPLDQYFMQHPEQLFGRSLENAQVDAGNMQLMSQHLVCAAVESPILLEEDDAFFGPGLADAVNTLMEARMLGRHPQATSNNIMHYIGHKDNPAQQISLRAIDPERFSIVNEADGGAVLEEIEESKAFFEVYDGAVYMYQGRTYLCKKLDLDSKVAVVRPAELKYYTRVRDFTDVHVLGGRSAYPKVREVPRQHSTSASCADCTVTTRWLGFYRVWQGSGEVFDQVDLFLPDVQFETQAAYLRVPFAAREAVRAAGLPWRDGLHAASHALLNVVPLHMLCGSTDMGTECDNPYDTRFRPERLLLYDKHPGGIGLANQAAPLFGVLMERALALIRGCTCVVDSGCPGCVQHAECGEYNAVLNKRSAIIILETVLAAEAEAAARTDGATRLEEPQASMC